MSRARPLLAVRRSASVPARSERVAWCVLALFACVLAHEVVYQLMYPDANAYRGAMTLMGHDGYWLGLSLAVAVTTIALVTVAAVQLRRLHAEATTTPALAADERAGIAHYLHLVSTTWLRLALLAALIFTAQENLEALGAGQPMEGIDVVLGHGGLPLLVILGATLLMSLAVGLVRWRRRVLLGRLAAFARPWARASTTRRRAEPTTPVRGRHPVRAWGSRAPPRRVTPIAL